MYPHFFLGLIFILNIAADYYAQNEQHYSSVIVTQNVTSFSFQFINSTSQITGVTISFDNRNHLAFLSTDAFLTCSDCELSLFSNVPFVSDGNLYLSHITVKTPGSGIYRYKLASSPNNSGFISLSSSHLSDMCLASCPFLGDSLYQSLSCCSFTNLSLPRDFIDTAEHLSLPEVCDIQGSEFSAGNMGITGEIVNRRPRDTFKCSNCTMRDCRRSGVALYRPQPDGYNKSSGYLTERIAASQASESQTRVYFTTVSFFFCQATGEYSDRDSSGGAIYDGYQTRLSVQRCQFEYCSATRNGGAIALTYYRHDFKANAPITAGRILPD